MLGVDTNKAKKRRVALDPDPNWFSTPPPGAAHLDSVESAPSSQATVPPSGNSSLPPSVPGSPSLPPSSLPLPSPTPPGHRQTVSNGESSTAGAALPAARQSTPRVRSRTGATYAYRTTPSQEDFAPVNLIPLPESPTATGSATTARSMLGEAPPNVGGTASAPSSRSSSEPHNGDGGTVLRCPQPVKPKSGRRKKRDEQKRLVASSTAAAGTPTLPEIAPAAPAVVNTEGSKELSRGNNGRTVSNAAPARDETPPGAVQLGSNEDASGTAKELSGDDDDPDLSMRAGLIVNGVSFSSR